MSPRSFLAPLLAAGLLAGCTGSDEADDDDVLTPDDDTSLPDDDTHLPDDDTTPPPDPVTYVEDFVDTADVESADAPLETGDGGWAVAPADETLEDPGLGEGGPWQVLVDEVISPGEYHLSSFEIAPGVNVETQGNVVLRVAGPFTMGAGSSWVIAGSLTVAARGAVSIGGQIVCFGTLEVHQTDAAGFDLPSESVLLTNQPNDAPPNHLRLWSRGPIHLEDMEALVLTDGTTVGPRSGDAEVRAYGDVTLSSGTYFGADNTQPFQPGDTRIWTEGSLSTDAGSYVTSGGGSVPGGGRVDVRALGDVSFTGGSWIIAESGGGVLSLRSEGSLRLDASTWASNGGGGIVNDALVEGASVEIVDGGYFMGLQGDGPTPSSLTVRSSSFVRITTEGGLHAPDVVCGDAGDVYIETVGDVEVSSDGYLDAGQAGTGCETPSSGGDIFIRAGGSVDTATGWLSPGVGDVPGAVDVSEGIPIDVVPDAGLRFPSVVTSRPLPMEGTTGEVLSFQVYATDPPGARVDLWISPDGTEGAFVPADQAIGALLGEGWRYRLVVHGRMFDPARADGFEIVYQ